MHIKYHGKKKAGNPKHKQSKAAAEHNGNFKTLNKKKYINEYRTMGEQCVYNVCKNNNNNSKIKRIEKTRIIIRKEKKNNELN